jgi:polyisoprenoid-binding protein YceI
MQTTYKIDPAHSTAQFVVRHMMISNVRGGFGNVQGTAVVDSVNPENSSVEATIEVSGINTNDPNRDGHLKSADFLHADQYPTITFQSRKVSREGDDLVVTGDLSIHGVTHEAKLKVEGPTSESKDPMGNTRIGASATTKIKRSDYGLTYNMAIEAGGVVIGDDLKIELEVSMIKQ